MSDFHSVWEFYFWLLIMLLQNRLISCDLFTEISTSYYPLIYCHKFKWFVVNHKVNNNGKINYIVVLRFARKVYIEYSPRSLSFISTWISGICSSTIILFFKQWGKSKTTNQTSVKIKPILVVSIWKIIISPLQIKQGSILDKSIISPLAFLILKSELCRMYLKTINTNHIDI